ncbi:hypothetical protein [Gelidibacter maritimus]|uniref:Uncharacterized protein n=1 Tax=Gelidibacter maritimus TaxID=2761487 RepID=A0A7W2M774_9FLAO|nr:hypothetical protein [Gelidibacter maritimus]MBA6153938.1 hypothetical protein [Gelidibacter maritimus]
MDTFMYFIVVAGSVLFLYFLLKFIFSSGNNEVNYDTNLLMRASENSFSKRVDEILQDADCPTNKLIAEMKKSFVNRVNTKLKDSGVQNKDLIQEDSPFELINEKIISIISNNINNHVLINIENTSSLKNSPFGYILLMDTINGYEEIANVDIKSFFDNGISDYEVRSIFLKASIQTIEKFRGIDEV